MDQEKKIKKISVLRGSIRPAKRALIATTKKRIKDLLEKKEKSKDHMIQAKFDKEIKSARGVIGCLKTLQTTDIIKFGLRTDCEQLQAIIQKGQADVNARALARLCSKDIMQKAFQEFKVNNPDWKKIPISAFKIVKGVQKSNQTGEDKKISEGKKALKLQKKCFKEISDDQDEVKAEKSPQKKEIAKSKAIVQKEAVSSPVLKNEQSKVQSPKKALSKKRAENVDESKDEIKSKLSKKIKPNASTVKVTPSPAKKLRKRKSSEAGLTVSTGRGSIGLPDKTPKRVKFDDELTKTQKNKSQSESTPKNELKPIIKKTPSDTKQKIQKPTRGNSLPERRTRKKLSM